MLLRSYNMLRYVADISAVDMIAPFRKDVVQGMYDDVNDAWRDIEENLGRLTDKLQILDTPIGSRKYSKYLGAAKSLLMRSSYSVDWLSSGKIAEAVRAAMADRKYDILHADTVSMVQYLLPQDQKNVVINHHNIESDMLRVRADAEANSLFSKYLLHEANVLERFERVAVANARLNLVCSAEDEVRLKSIDPTAATAVVPNGVDTDYFRPSEGGRRTGGLIFVGGQSWYPNRAAIEHLISDVWPLLSAAVPDLRFDLIGKNPSPLTVQFASQNEGFHVHGFVPDIRDMVDRAKIYVCPISDGGGTKLKILDALSMGKAIVAYPHAVDGINVEHGKNVLIADSPATLTGHIVELMSNDELRESLEREARKLAIAEYSYGRIGRDLQKIYSCL